MKRTAVLHMSSRTLNPNERELVRDRTAGVLAWYGCRVRALFGCDAIDSLVLVDP
mgnify:CR=1 FL=1